MPKLLNDKRQTSLKVSEAMGLISPLIHVGQFKTDSAKVLGAYHMDVSQIMSQSPEDVARDLDTNEETIVELMEVCSPDRLACVREAEIDDWEDITLAPSDTGLETVGHWININKARQMEKKCVTLKSKYTEYDCCLENDIRGTPAKNQSDAVKSPETVLTVAVNFPRSSRAHKHTTVNFRILGSQKLTELRDKIPCALDEQPVGSFTENPDHPRDIKSKDLCKTSYFFIGNTFYNDNRFESSDKALSKYVFEWAKANDLVIPDDVKEVDMDDYIFDDLNLCLGSPYLYMHQGDCEHIIIFKDIRLLHPDDCLSRSMYPLAVSRAKFKSIVCKVCNHYISTWCTRNDEFSDEDPSFFCDVCFRMLHYLKDGTPAGEFVAFPVVNREELTY